jgi:hypothetical protein
MCRKLPGAKIATRHRLLRVVPDVTEVMLVCRNCYQPRHIIAAFQ